MLSKFIVDFIGDRQLRETFEVDPSAVFDRYAVGMEERALLRGGMSAAVIQQVVKEIAHGLVGARDVRDLDTWSVRQLKVDAAAAGLPPSALIEAAAIA